LVNVAAYAGIFVHARLYANAALQVAYFGLNVLGWWRWTRGDGPAAPVTRTSGREGVVLALIVVTLAVGLHAVLAQTDSAAPWADAALTAASLVAQWQLTRKRADTWGWWVVINCGYVALLASARLWASLVQYAVFLGIAVAGHRRWWSAGKTPTPTHP
jgi:nicotinamide mononucleotide transporter